MFWVYARCSNEQLIHVTVHYSESRIKAISEYGKDQIGGANRYYLTGLQVDLNEDLASNFPAHVDRRIKNNGARIKYKGSLYEFRRNKSQPELLPVKTKEKEPQLKLF